MVSKRSSLWLDTRSAYLALKYYFLAQEKTALQLFKRNVHDPVDRWGPQMVVSKYEKEKTKKDVTKMEIKKEQKKYAEECCQQNV